MDFNGDLAFTNSAFHELTTISGREIIKATLPSEILYITGIASVSMRTKLSPKRAQAVGSTDRSRPPRARMEVLGIMQYGSANRGVGLYAHPCGYRPRQACVGISAAVISTGG